MTWVTVLTHVLPWVNHGGAEGGNHTWGENKNHKTGTMFLAALGFEPWPGKQVTTRHETYVTGMSTDATSNIGTPILSTFTLTLAVWYSRQALKGGSGCWRTVWGWRQRGTCLHSLVYIASWSRPPPLDCRTRIKIVHFPTHNYCQETSAVNYFIKRKTRIHLVIRT